MSPSQSSFRLPNRQRRTRALISLTPLIDVVFILLIFLMLVSNFLDRSAFDITMGAAGDAAVLKSDMPPLQLRLLGGGRAELDGVSTPTAKIGPALARAAGLRSAPTVLVSSDAGVDLQTVVTTMSTARRISGLKVFLVKTRTEK